MVTEVALETAAVVTVKPAAVLPAPTVTFGGTPTTVGLLLDNDTSAPPVGAAPESETNAEVFEPPVMLAGLTVICCSETAAPAGVTVRDAVRMAPL